MTAIIASPRAERDASYFGAVADGITDDAPALNTYAQHLKQYGGTMNLGSGTYALESTVEVSYDNHLNPNDGLGICIRGAGRNNTLLKSVTPNVYGMEMGESLPSNAAVSFLTMSGLTFIGNGALTDQGSHGLRVNALLFMDVQDLGFYGLRTGSLFHDSVTWSAKGCIYNKNYNGLICDGQGTLVMSTPNAVNLFHNVFYGNSNVAAAFVEGCNINFFGGTVESGGVGGEDANRAGVSLYNCGRYGGVGANFYGTYFEGNTNVADVWIQHNDYPATYNFHGCTFNRFGTPLNSPNCIRLDAGTAAPAWLNVYGSSFADRGNTPATATKYIQTYTQGAPIYFTHEGNQYPSSLEMPGNTSNRIFAKAKILGLSAPTLSSGFNISQVVRNGVGDYTIVFQIPSHAAQTTVVGSTDMAAFVRCLPLNSNSVKIVVLKPDGVTPVDPMELNLICME